MWAIFYGSSAIAFRQFWVDVLSKVNCSSLYWRKLHLITLVFEEKWASVTSFILLDVLTIFAADFIEWWVALFSGSISNFHLQYVVKLCITNRKWNVGMFPRNEYPTVMDLGQSCFNMHLEPKYWKASSSSNKEYAASLIDLYIGTVVQFRVS